MILGEEERDINRKFGGREEEDGSNEQKDRGRQKERGRKKDLEGGEGYA